MGKFLSGKLIEHFCPSIFLFFSFSFFYFVVFFVLPLLNAFKTTTKLQYSLIHEKTCDDSTCTFSEQRCTLPNASPFEGLFHSILVCLICSVCHSYNVLFFFFSFTFLLKELSYLTFDACKNA